MGEFETDSAQTENLLFQQEERLALQTKAQDLFPFTQPHHKNSRHANARTSARASKKDTAKANKKQPQNKQINTQHTNACEKQQANNKHNNKLTKQNGIHPLLQPSPCLREVGAGRISHGRLPLSTPKGHQRRFRAAPAKGWRTSALRGPPTTGLSVFWSPAKRTFDSDW